MRKTLALVIIVLVLGVMVPAVPVAHAEAYTITKRYAVDRKTDSATSSSIAWTLANVPTEGDTLIATLVVRVSTAGPPTFTSITQTGVTWTQVVHGVYQTLTACDIWIGVVGAGAQANMSIAMSGTGQPHEFVGNCADYPLGLAVDLTAKSDSQGAGTSKVTGTLASACSNSYGLLIGCCYSQSSAETTPTNGFTLTDGALFGTYVTNAFLERSPASTITSSGISTSGSVTGAGCIASFKPTSAPAGYFGYTLSCLYEDDTTLASKNVTMTDATSQFLLLISSTPTVYVFNEAITQITWAVGSYTRNIYPTNGGTYKITVPQAGATTSIYQFNIKDYSNILTDPSYLEAWRVVGVTSTLITQAEIIDTLNGVPLALIYTGVYEIIVKCGSTSYSQGFIQVADDYSMNILLKELNFSESAIISYKYVTVEATRPNDTTIYVAWNNTLTTDYNITSGTIYVNYRNGTQATNSSIGTTQAGSLTWASAVNSTDYVVLVDISHQYLGAVDYEKLLPGVEAEASDFPSLDVFGTMGSTSTAQEALAVASMWIVAGAVSFASIPLGALSLVALGGFYSYRGVMDIDSGFLWTIIGLVGLLFLASRRGG